MGKEKAPPAAPTVAEVDELPRTIVRRVVKEKLSEISGDNGDVNLHKEALIAFSESARIFIHYLSATAHDICTESKRQIINAEDVLKALEDIEFSEFVEPLREALEEFRRKAAGKRAGAAKAKEVAKKSKTVEEATEQNGKDESEQVIPDNHDEDEDQGNEDEEQGNEDEDQGNEDDGDEVQEQVSGDNEDEAEDEDEDEDQSSGDDDDSHE